MLYGQERDQLRGLYCEAWQRHRQGETLQPLQVQIVAVIAEHPEYQSLLENPERALGKDYLPELGETNPFLHMSMHLALREQISTDRPTGVRGLYQKLAARHADHHALEHRLMECLAEALWQAQRDAAPPDEDRYLDCIRKLAGGDE
jgi:hypothetical protein